jgi:hypothetical protein
VKNGLKPLSEAKSNCQGPGESHCTLMVIC